ncbi:MAG: outer membrane protein assembly factor BamD [Pyrinomonadaceae bacterium MAG19_C2-C3]|nr:outer membrane protein assembly factor BamD [Pyrinomonadaceae bacterium MAG19_C2-C3]
MKRHKRCHESDGTTRKQRCWSRRKVTTTMIVMLCVAAGGMSVVIGCGWSGTSRSVRFNGVFTEREFDLLPPFSEHLGDDYPRGVNGVDESEDPYNEDYEAQEADSEKTAKEIKDTVTRARSGEARGDLQQAREAWQTYLRLTENTPPVSYARESKDAEDEPSRNSVIDRLDALAELERGARRDAVRQYLKARDAYDKWATDSTDVSNTNEALFGVEGAKALDDASRDARLNDNAFYLWCAALYRAKQYESAAFNFAKLVDQNKRSDKRDAALLMKGLSWLKQSASFREGDGNALSSSRCAECADAGWHHAQDAFAQLLREYPRGRYAMDARGWLGYLALRVGRTGDALVEYYRMLAPESNRATRFDALVSLRLTRPRATPADMNRVEELLAREPQTALAYVYHNLYNYTFSGYLNFDSTDAVADAKYGSNDYEYNDRVRKQRAEAAKREELERIARFTERLMKTYPRTKVEAAFMLRLAQANLELDREKAAWDLAKRAMTNGLRADLLPEALWVQAVAAHRLKQHDAARHTLTRFIKDYPHHRLIEGARRQLAIVAEDAGDRAAALEQYFALDYEEDIAYFVDVLMTPEELRAYIDDRPRDKKIDELWYSLGVRYMRAGRWTEAREAYAHVRTSSEFSNYYYSPPCQNSYGEDSICDPKDPRDEKGVAVSWVARDLKTINDLESFERHIAQATNSETKAETMYQMAGYLFDGSALLFYNPAMWRGGRQWSLSHVEPFRAPGDVGIFQEYLREHSTRFHALEIYLRLIRDYPRTRVAPDAMYTAAVCYERLVHSSYFWNDVYDVTAYQTGRIITYADVRRAYPRYQLPRGTYGWQPSTRTVNGGAGWASPPKPQPRLTRWQRAERKLKPFWTYAVTTIQNTQTKLAHFWQHTLRRWLLLALFFVSTFITARLAGHARRCLRIQIRRMELPAHERINPRKARRFLHRVRRHAATLAIEPRDEARILATASARMFTRYSAPLIRNRQARSIIVFNFVAHTLLALSVMSLIKTW